MNGFSDIIEARINFTAVSFEEDCSVLTVDGALALAPYSKYYIMKPIVMAFQNSGEINNAVFALYINNFTMTDEETEPRPTLEIGGFDLNKFSSRPEELFYIKYETTYGVRTVTFDSIEMGLWSAANSTVLFSTIERYIIGDLNDYFDFIPYLITMGLTCELSPDDFVIACDKPKSFDLPGFTFKYSNYTIELSPYSIWDCKKDSCKLLIEFKVAGYWVFGQLFLENYYTIYNYENSSIGFAPAATSHIKKQDSSDSHNPLHPISIPILILAFT